MAFITEAFTYWIVSTNRNKVLVGQIIQIPRVAVALRCLSLICLDVFCSIFKKKKNWVQAQHLLANIAPISLWMYGEMSILFRINKEPKVTCNG